MLCSYRLCQEEVTELRINVVKTDPAIVRGFCWMQMSGVGTLQKQNLYPIDSLLAPF